MKTSMTTLALAGLLALAASGASAATTVNYVEPDRFSDIPFAPWDRENVLQQLTDHFTKLGQSLPPDQDLRIDVLDVDLAGIFYPELNHGQGLRVMRGRADWPRMQLRYTLTQNGQVIKSGESRIQDMDYQDHLNRYFDSEPLRYEKQMIDDWFVKTIGPIRRR